MGVSGARAPASTLRVGAGRAAIELPAELFPTEGFSGIHDPLHARAVLLDGGEKVLLLSLEMTSLPEERVTVLRDVAAEAGVSPDNVWVCVTHTMSAPHFVPEPMSKTVAEERKNGLLWQAVESAVRGAAKRAAAGLQEARMGHTYGPCDVNVNRDVLTKQGWWLGCNEQGFSDKTLSVVRLESLGGEPLALLFSHCVRPAVMERPPGSGCEGDVTADLAGAASSLVEQEYGNGVVAPFFMGTAGDQAPALTGVRMQYAGRGGKLRVVDLGAGGHAVAQTIGGRLGAAVLRLSEQVVCETCEAPIVTSTFDVVLSGQQNTPTHLLRPSTHHTFLSGPERVEPVDILRLGEAVFVGVRPELSCRTGASIREGSPFRDTLLFTMVNGAAKYMPEAAAYDHITYEALSSPFARGSAERLVEAISVQLNEMAGR